MAEKVGGIELDLTVNQKQFNKQMHGISATAKKAGAILAAAFSVKKIIDFGKSCVNLGSDLQEVQNVVDVAFPRMTAQVDKFAKRAAASFGLSETMAKRYTAMFGTMAKQFGFSEKAAYDMGTTLAGLAGDVASFYNITQDEAYTKLKAVFSGETEVLKDIGIVMTQNALDAYALANGYGKTTKAMSEMEKVALRYAFVQNQLSAASGDFARTSDSWANQVRILKLNFESLKATIGQGLINVLTPVLKVINSLLSKLMTLASAFKSFTELITGKKADTGGSIKETAAGITETVGATDSLANSASGVGTAAKKAAKEMRSLMGFDQINKLSEPAEDADSSGSGGGTGGGSPGSVDFGSLAEGETVVDKLDSRIQSLIDRCKELASLFKKGFVIGFGDSEKRIQSIQKHINSIGKSLKDIFTDSTVVNAANKMFDSIAFNSGKIAGSMVSIGSTIADNLLGGIDKYLQGSKDYIKDRLVGIFDVTSEISNLVGDFYAAASDIFSTFSGENAKKCTASIIGIFSDGFFGALELSGQFTADIINTITKPFVENKDIIKEAIDNTLAPIAEILDTIHKSVKYVFEEINRMYQEHISPMFQSFKDGFSEICEALFSGYNEHIAPVLDEMAEKFRIVWEEHIQPALNGIIDLIGKISDTLKILWETVLLPFVEWVIDTIMPVLGPILEGIGSLFLDFFAVAGDVVKGITDILSGFLDFCTGIFTGDFSLCWEGLGQILEGFKEIVGSIFGFIEKYILTPFIDFMENVFSTDWSENFGFFGEILNSFLKNVSNIWESVKRIFGGITEFIAGVFTGDWKRAWDGIKDIFGGIWDSFIGLVKSPINSIIGFLNGLISAVASCVNSVARMLNNLNIDAPDWVTDLTGITSIGFNLPTWKPAKIPYLAQGGYVKPNTPQLAMIGDNRHQGEIVAPEGKLQDMVNAAVRAAGTSGGITRIELESIINNAVMRIIAALSEMGFYLDGQLLAKAIRRAMEELDYRENPVKVI